MSQKSSPFRAPDTFVLMGSFLLLAALATWVLPGGLKAGEISQAMIQGARELVSTALIIALAQGILVLAEAGRIIDTALHGLSGAIGGFHPIITSQLMVLVQTALNFVVPSGSGQAALTMPIMAPLADLVDADPSTMEGPAPADRTPRDRSVALGTD